MDDICCFLCGLTLSKAWHDFDHDIYQIACRRCGTYLITRECSYNPRSADPSTLAAVSAATRQAAESGSRLLLRMDNWDEVAAAHEGTPVRHKLSKLLQYIASKSQNPGDAVSVDMNMDYPVFDGRSLGECAFLLEHARESGFFAPNRGDNFYTLSVKGWEQVEPPLSPAGIPGRCFVAMSFAEELDEAYLLGIKPAVEHDCGYTAVRMKELQHNSDICDRLLSEIRQAQFIVADFTDHKNGVYYEAGFARALGREVINCCRDTDFDKLHFDTNHLNHIKWQEPTGLRQQLANRIRATILRTTLR